MNTHHNVHSYDTFIVIIPTVAPIISTKLIHSHDLKAGVITSYSFDSHNLLMYSVYRQIWIYQLGKDGQEIQGHMILKENQQ